MCVSSREEKFLYFKLEPMVATFQCSGIGKINPYLKPFNPTVGPVRGRILTFPVKIYIKLDNTSGVVLRQGVMGAVACFSHRIGFKVLQFVSEKLSNGARVSLYLIFN